MIWTITLRNVCATGALAIALTGCGPILAPRADPAKFYLLTPTADPPSVQTAAVQSSAGGFTLGLGPVKLPPYLDRPEVVTRSAPNRLDLSKTDRWGES